MSIIAGYNDPIKIQLNYDAENNPISVEMQPESHVVLNGRITLIQIPDKFYRVQINGFTELYEYDNSEMQATNYRVDYQTGIIMLHNSLEGQTITVSKYWGRGIVLTPISRIYTRVENGNVVETLGQVIEDGSDALTAYGGIVKAITDAETKTTTLNNKILEGNTTEQNLDISILNADTKNTELNNTIDNAIIAKNNLDNSITIGQQTKQDLDTSIANGDIQSIRDSVSDLAGEGRTVETVKSNADKIGVLSTMATVEKTNLAGAVSEVKNEIVSHKAEMVSQSPHGIGSIAGQDYLEGVFTPFISGSNVEGANTYNLQQGRYKKLGKTVVFLIELRLETKDPLMSGRVAIGGLPFISNRVTSCAIGRIDYVTYSTNSKGLLAHTINTFSKIELNESLDNNVYTPLDSSKITDNTLIFISGTYQTN